MARKSPLLSAQPDSVSVGGQMLRKGQSRLLDPQAIGPRERRLEKQGKIAIYPSNTTGKVQVLCKLR